MHANRHPPCELPADANACAPLEVHNLCKAFGANQANRNICLNLLHGEIHALIGPNGAGKSTLISQIAGEITPDAGEIRIYGEPVTALNAPQRARKGLGRSFQISAIIAEFTVLENLLLVIHSREKTLYRSLAAYDSSPAFLQEATSYAEQTQIEPCLHTPGHALAHGQRRCLELAMALALKPKIFLLDEPLAGLDRNGVATISTLLQTLKHKAPILLIEHDMDAVFSLANRISVLVSSEIIATGSPDAIRSSPQVRHAYLGEDFATC